MKPADNVALDGLSNGEKHEQQQDNAEGDEPVRNPVKPTVVNVQLSLAKAGKPILAVKRHVRQEEGSYPKSARAQRNCEQSRISRPLSLGDSMDDEVCGYAPSQDNQIGAEQDGQVRREVLHRNAILLSMMGSVHTPEARASGK
ncbi:MAG: hypothetical protein IT581_18910 [Verrucomicrobiales bacterium]|nr:hypothetical protein [Verrucomicrobiales bacterium]